MSDISNIEQYKTGCLYQVPLGEIEADPNQPRKFFDKKELNKLSQSIKNKGVLQPVIIRVCDNQLLLIAGERRLRASKIARLKSIPAIVVEGDSAEISLIENIQREDLNPIEEAEAIAKLIEINGYKDKDLVPILGKAKSTISEMKKLNLLPARIKDQCRKSNQWSRNVLLEIAKQPTKKKMLELFNEVKKNNLKGREVRTITRGRSRKRNKASIIVDKLHNVFNSFTELKFDEIEDEQKKNLRTELRDIRKKIDSMLDNLKTQDAPEELSLFDDL